MSTPQQEADRVTRRPILEERILKRRAARRRRQWRHLPWFPMIYLGLVVIAAVFAPLLVAHDPNAIDLRHRLQPPAWLAGGSSEYWLGVDSLGRDVAARLIYGARVSLIVGLAGVTLGGLIGLTLGIIAGYKGGLVGDIIMRVVDAFLALPLLLIAMVMAIGLGQGMHTLVIAIAILLWARFARVIRGEVLELRSRQFIAQAKVSGLSDLRIMLIHVLPNVMSTFVVLMTLDLAWVILVEASLSFLGAGIPPPTASWGGMVADGREFVVSGWWISVVPGVALALTILSVNLLGDWVRDRLDPKLRQL